MVISGETAYGIKANGHNVPYSRTMSAPENLVRQALDYLKDDLRIATHRAYRFAEAAVSGVWSVEEIHALALDPRLCNHPRAMHLGALFSALYNTHVTDRMIVNSVDCSMLVGQGFGCSKLFINQGIVGNYCANDSSGVFINLGDAGDFLGYGSKGIIINAGKAGRQFGQMCEGIIINVGITDLLAGDLSKGTFVDFSAVDSYGRMERATLVLPAGSAMPSFAPYPPPSRGEISEELGRYVHHLVAGASSPEQMIKSYGANPAKRIADDIIDLVRACKEKEHDC
jgi:hypothetical protein